MANEKVIYKKVAPYPIKASMGLSPQPVEGHILKLTLSGFLIDVHNAVIHVGQSLSIHFMLPASEVVINSMVRVIKTYDRLLGTAATPQPTATAAAAPAPAPAQAPAAAPTEIKRTSRVQRIAEMHFVRLPESSKEDIEKFLKAIKQVDIRR